MPTTFTPEQWRIGRDLLDDPAKTPTLVAKVTLAGPAVTALLINLGVL